MEQGRCARCDSDLCYAARKCTECGLAFCLDCALRSSREQRDVLEVARITHTLDSSHKWMPAGTHDHCDKCNRGGALANVMLCACSATLCVACRTPAPESGLIWIGCSPLAPCKFQVIDSKNMCVDQKLEYITADIGPGADIALFSRTALAMFPERASVASQRNGCLTLYSKYAGIDLHKECLMPPDIRTEFFCVWDAHAPRCCNECATACDDDAFYYSLDCANAGLFYVCTRCERAADIIDRCMHCSACDGAPVVGDDGLARFIRNSKRSFALMGGYFVERRNATHEPIFGKGNGTREWTYRTEPGGCQQHFSKPKLFKSNTFQTQNFSKQKHSRNQNRFETKPF